MILAICALFISCLKANIIVSNPVKRQDFIAAESLNITGLPIKINSVSVIYRLHVPQVKLTVSNLSSEQVMKLHLMLFIFDSEGKLKGEEEFPEEVDFSLNQDIDILYIPATNLVKGDKPVVALQRVIGRLGVWSVAPLDLENIVKASISDARRKSLRVTYTEHLAITDEDKAEIQALSLQHILHDKRVGDFFSIKDSKNVNLLSDKTESSIVKKVSGTQVNILSLDELQEKANRDGEIFYFIFPYINFEGTTAQLSIAYTHKVRARSLYSPCCGHVSLILSKDTGNWRIVETVIAGK
jgi:hypothetical protein